MGERCCVKLLVATRFNILETRAWMGWMEVCPCLSLDRHRKEGLISPMQSMTSLLGSDDVHEQNICLCGGKVC
jgi:hypothetical protein